MIEWAVYRRDLDGNVFDWIIRSAEVRRKLLKAEKDRAIAKAAENLKAWTSQKWRTKSGKPSTQGSEATGERYLPEKAIKALSPQEYAATTRSKRAGRAQGKQFVAQPKAIAKKVVPHRKVK